MNINNALLRQFGPQRISDVELMPVAGGARPSR
jgi:hypothetical protein